MGICRLIEALEGRPYPRTCPSCKLGPCIRFPASKTPTSVIGPKVGQGDGNTHTVSVEGLQAEIARLTAALADAEARTAALVAGAYEAAALVCDKTAQEFYAEEDQDFCAPIAVRMASLAAEIRALAQKEAGE